ncbi:hypothetical protein CYY_000664 [Polysphondylium violaceum]|uniref:DUF4460 domain-containing protein n=1 Tax=Polysphondylium violaceum TaxID=133409 RepID=A0A8J4QAL1_9MYCE|nr:hypothetical protein CYY_000664 [Polysphondylium violaceum]
MNQLFSRISISPRAGAKVLAHGRITSTSTTTSRLLCATTTPSTTRSFNTTQTSENDFRRDNFNVSQDQYYTGNGENLRETLVEVSPNQLPYHHSAKDVEKNIRAYLNKFFLRVHPDLFFNNVDLSVHNQKSLTQLNNLLRTLDDYIKVSQDVSDTTKLEKVPTTVDLSFHIQPEDESESVQLVNHTLQFAEASPSILSSRTSLVEYTIEFRFSTYRQIYDLLEKSGIVVSQSDKEAVKTPTTQPKEMFDDPWEEYFTNKPVHLSLSQQVEEFLEKFPVTPLRRTSEHHAEHQVLIDGFQESKVYFYFGESAKGDADYMRQLGFRQLVDDQLVHLKENLLALEYGDWQSLPIMITDAAHKDKLEKNLAPKGFVVLEKDFQAAQVLPYVKSKVIPYVMKSFNEISSITLNNRAVLEEKAIGLEEALGSTSVVIENLFSINQKNMQNVRDKFNTSLGLVGELKIPVINFLDATKAQLWKSLPSSKLDVEEVENWKLNNITTSEKERTELILDIQEKDLAKGRVPSDPEQIVDQHLYLQEKYKNNLPNTIPDQREKPLQFVDKYSFNEIQSTPYLNQSLTAIERLKNLINTPVPVPFYFQDQNSTVDPLSGFDFSAAPTEDPALKSLFGSSNKAPIDTQLQDNVKPATTNEIVFPKLFKSNTIDFIGTTAAETTEKAATESSEFNFDFDLGDKKTEAKSLEDELNSFLETLSSPSSSSTSSTKTNVKENNTPQEKNKDNYSIVYQKLSDFNWSKVHLIISDRYQFIFTEDRSAGFLFIPSNFKDIELFLFLNASQDGFEQLYKGESPAEDAQYLKSILAIKGQLDSFKSALNLRNAKIENTQAQDKGQQFSSIRAMTNIASHTENKEMDIFRTIGKNVDWYIGTTDKVTISRDGKHATIVSNISSRSFKKTVSNILNYLSIHSPYFKEIIERKQIDLSTDSELSEIDNTTNESEYVEKN